MDVDQTALIFIVEYYEMFSNNKVQLNSVYAEGARIVLYNQGNRIQQYTQNFHNVVPSGEREILACSGEIIGTDLYVHVKSSLTLPNKKLYLDECFRCLLSDSNIMILYHSIHVNPLLTEIPPLPQNSPKPAPKPIPKPPSMEVNSPQELDYKKSVVIYNLPFNIPPSKFVSVLNSKIGHVEKYVQSEGKLLAQFESNVEQKKAVETTFDVFHGRTPKAKWMPRDFSF